jgi:hypothetical protein
MHPCWTNISIFTTYSSCLEPDSPSSEDGCTYWDGVICLHATVKAVGIICLYATVSADRWHVNKHYHRCRLRLKRDGTRAKPRFRFSAKQTSPFKSAGESVQSTTGSRGVRTAVVMLDTQSSEVVWRVLATHFIRQFPLHSPRCVTVCHHISTGLYVQPSSWKWTLGFETFRRHRNN